MADIVAPVGPVDIAVVAFDEPKFDGSIASAIADLVAGGIVRVLDIVLVNKDADGQVTILEVTDVDGDGIPDLVAVQGDIPAPPSRPCPRTPPSRSSPGRTPGWCAPATPSRATAAL